MLLLNSLSTATCYATFVSESIMVGDIWL